MAISFKNSKIPLMDSPALLLFATKENPGGYVSKSFL
jgi:hypothetical protein